MADTVDIATRSAIMRAIRGKDTKPELLVRRLLHRQGFRYGLHAKSLPGRPDIVLRKYRAVVMVHGCFWHGHADCPYYRLPGTRPEFWSAKIVRNRANDLKAEAALKAKGWRVALVWECALKGRRRLSENTVAAKLGRWIRSSSRSLTVTGRKLPEHGRSTPAKSPRSS